jgi:hypothetical protein
MTYTWTQHTFRCRDCGRLSFISKEALDEEVANYAPWIAQGPMTPAQARSQAASTFSYCLSCDKGKEIEGEHPDQTAFDFVKVNDDASATYSAAHEIWNVVSITLPTGYFFNVLAAYDITEWQSGEWPPVIYVQSFNVVAGG